MVALTEPGKAVIFYSPGFFPIVAVYISFIGIVANIVVTIIIRADAKEPFNTLQKRPNDAKEPYETLQKDLLMQKRPVTPSKRDLLMRARLR